MGVKEQIRPLGPSFAQTLAILTQLTPGQMIPSGVVRGLSNLHPSLVMAMVPVWVKLENEVKRDVMQALIELSASDFETDYTLVGMMAIDDEDAEVRRLAVELTSFIEERPYMDTLFEIAQNDASDEVRAAALKALGPFILRGELGTLEENATAPVVQYLLSVLRDRREDSEVRARALESIGYSSHEAVTVEIRRAYNGDDGRMKTSSIFAMGASGDDQWAEFIVYELERGSAENRFEAARAAGELLLQEAVRPLSQLVFGEDSEVVREAVWALGEIGGKEAARVLEALLEQVAEDEDDDFIDLIEDALDNANAAAGAAFGFDSPAID
jgi:HEAT repeat protein